MLIASQRLRGESELPKIKMRAGCWHSHTMRRRRAAPLLVLNSGGASALLEIPDELLASGIKIEFRSDAPRSSRQASTPDMTFRNFGFEFVGQDFLSVCVNCEPAKDRRPKTRILLRELPEVPCSQVESGEPVIRHRTTFSLCLHQALFPFVTTVAGRSDLRRNC